jgi:hypothetical protein
MLSHEEESRHWMIHYLARASALLFAGIAVVAAASAADNPPPPKLGDWHLLRSANPQGGPDAVSMIHTADTGRSDLELAGLMLRCGEKGVDLVVVVVTPFPPPARPSVMIGANGKEWRFDASIVSPGAELLLPMEAMSLARGTWQSARELTIKVSSPEQSFGGVIPIDGLADALSTLVTKCPAR